MRNPRIPACTFCIVLFCAGLTGAAPVVPDAGGTAANPWAVTYVNLDANLMILDGLPPGTGIEIDVRIGPPSSFGAVVGTPLTGETVNFGQPLSMTMNGTGLLAGFSRTKSISSITSRTSAAPRTPGAVIQTFSTDFLQFQGQLAPGDPDFDLLRITAGTDFGMPSPGQTTLTQQVSGWAVDSFFDITYRIDFVGSPGGPLAGRSGSTTGTVRIVAVPEPSAACLLAVGVAGTLLRRKR